MTKSLITLAVLAGLALLNGSNGFAVLICVVALIAWFLWLRQSPKKKSKWGAQYPTQQDMDEYDDDSRQ